MSIFPSNCSSSNDSGTALIELAIVIPFFIIMIISVLKLGELLVETSIMNQNTYEIARRAAAMPTATAQGDLEIFSRNLAVNWGKFAEVGGSDTLNVEFENTADDNASTVSIRFNAPLTEIIGGSIFGLPYKTSAKIRSPYLLRTADIGANLALPQNPQVLTSCDIDGDGVGDFCNP